ncbi:hypothetical protein EJ08DRAFT_574293, partial [Tothia fuscella]
MLSRTLLLALVPGAIAHYRLQWPTGRGFSEQNIVSGPCGGFDTVGARTEIPINNFPIQLSMEHTEVRGFVTIALGNNPGNAFNTVIKPVFQENGPENFCIGGVSIPASLNLTAGTNATIQVVTNGDPLGGLYQCADVTFVDAPLSTSDYDSHCKNSTGVSASFNGGAFPNGTSGASTASSGTARGSAASTATSKALAAQQTLAGWALGAMGLVG